jgi:segregation and condensation protein B
MVEEKPQPETSKPSRRAPALPEVCADESLAARIEALLVCSDRPVTEARLAALLGIETTGAAKRVKAAIETLNTAYDANGRSFRIERLAGGWQILTRSNFGELLHRMRDERQHGRLSQAALETLAIIAYRQPIMRAEIEAIRGVACGEVLRGLMERRLIRISGRAEELGRPMLYGTTHEFLKVFGLSSPDDLPALAGDDGGRSSRPVAAVTDAPVAPDAPVTPCAPVASEADDVTEASAPEQADEPASDAASS